jgi:hypothetical protein
MALKSTVAEMKRLMHEIMHDLEKTEKGNRAAAQRARTCSIALAKVAKHFRKESIAEHRKGKKVGGARKKAAPKKKTAKRKGRR